jgi:dTDP-glucose 4,6-dehydratase
MSDRVLVTGGLGFIGSAFVRALAGDGVPVLNVDLETYAGDRARIAELPAGLVRTVHMDVASPELVELVGAERPRLVVHFAAETHVTRSENAAERFFHTNVEGTRRVLEAAAHAGVPRVLHMSTDEVYGPCPGEPFREDEKRPGAGLATSPYARSKAEADDLALGFAGGPQVVVARPTNCIGPWQHPEKAVPRWATRALRGERLPVWGDGGQVRDWMHVQDAVAGLRLLAERGQAGTAYNVGPAAHGVPNLEIARLVAGAAGREADAVYLSHYDRPEHDRRYAVDTSRIRELGWSPAHDLRSAVTDTVAWYRDHAAWWSALLPDAEALYAD